jgi:hypothetical protein
VEWRAWQKARLVPEQIQFLGKKSLKRKKAVKGRVIWMSALSAAAALALLIVLLRMDPVVPGPDLSIATSEETLTSRELSTEIQDEQPTVIQDEQPAVVQEESPVAVKEREAVSVKKVQKRDAELVTERSQVPSEGLSDPPDSGLQVEPEPRPIRMAGNLSSTSELLAKSKPDQIDRIHIPTVSPKLASLSLGQIAAMDRKELFEDFTEEHDISLMSVANAGIKGINKLTGSDISLMASRDEEGDVSGFRLKSKRFSLTRPLGREE